MFPMYLIPHLDEYLYPWFGVSLKLKVREIRVNPIEFWNGPKNVGLCVAYSRIGGSQCRL